jgi:SH3-like domain-containing protein
MLAGGIVVKVAVLIERRRWRRIRKPEEGRAYMFHSQMLRQTQVTING